MINERYPIGEFQCPEIITKEQLQLWINDIETLPEKLKEVVENLSNEALLRTYRNNSWTIRQLVHHIADSHLNSFIRFKLALTEDNPTIKPYDENKWAVLADTAISVEASLSIIEGLHQRWTHLLKTLSDAQLKRTFYHPDSGLITLEKNIGIYAWHGNHHLAHVQQALSREI